MKQSDTAFIVFGGKCRVKVGIPAREGGFQVQAQNSENDLGGCRQALPGLCAISEETAPLTVAAPSEARCLTRSRDSGIPSGSERFLGLEYSPQYHLAVSPPAAPGCIHVPEAGLRNARGIHNLRLQGVARR